MKGKKGYERAKGEMRGSEMRKKTRIMLNEMQCNAMKL